MKKNTALIFSDLHLDFSKIKSENGELSLRSLDVILKKVKELNPKYLFNLGDTFHKKDNVSATLQVIYSDFVKKASLFCDVIELVGNHDFSTKVDKKIYHARSNSEILKNVTTVDSCFRLKNLGFIRYCRSREEFLGYLNKLGDIDFLFAHLDLNGFALGESYIEKNAYFSPDEFKKFKLKKVFSGHYHEPQTQMIKGVEITFIGSVDTTSFGESDQEKRFLLLDLDSGEFESIPTNLTLHRTIKINATDKIPELSQSELDNGVKFRLDISGSREEIDLIDLPKKYKAKIKISINSKKKRNKIKLDSSDALDNLVTVFTKEEIKRYEKTQLDEQELVRMGQSFLRQALSK